MKGVELIIYHEFKDTVEENYLVHHFRFTGPIGLDKRVSKDTDSETKKSITLVVVMEN